MHWGKNLFFFMLAKDAHSEMIYTEVREVLSRLHVSPVWHGSNTRRK